MIWFVIGILVLLAGGGAVLFVVLHATGSDDSAPFAPTDDSPTGDTTEHAGEQSGTGETVGGQDAERSSGSGRPYGGGGRGDGDGSDAGTPLPADRFKSDVVGGEAEGESTARTGEAPHPHG